MKLRIGKIGNLPRAWGNCKCPCHSSPGVLHVVPCCGPKDQKNTESEIKSKSKLRKQTKQKHS